MEWTTDNMDESQKHYADWKQLDAEDNIMSDSITWNSEKDKTVVTESLSVVTRVGWR